MAATRFSRQRESIYNAVRCSHSHPTADMVYQALREEYPNLSLGTVYRNLNLLASEGKLVRMPFPVERYDGDLTPHCHFRCERCESVSDVVIPYDHALDDVVAKLGCKVTGHTTVFTGLCQSCAAEEERKDAV